MDLLGTLHLSLAVAAIGIGGAVALAAKGTRRHRWCGRGYVAAMLGLNVTALMIYDLFGGFGPFHWMALASLATLAAGWLAVYRRRPPRGWVRLHGEMMGWSYVGLLAAAAAEGTSRLPGAPFGLSVIATSVLVIGVGGYLLRARLPAAVRGLSRTARRST